MRNAFHLPPQPAQCLSRDKQSVLTVSRTNLLPGCCLLLGASASLQPDTISGWVALLPPLAPRSLCSHMCGTFPPACMLCAVARHPMHALSILNLSEKH